MVPLRSPSQEPVGGTLDWNGGLTSRLSDWSGNYSSYYIMLQVRHIRWHQIKTKMKQE